MSKNKDASFQRTIASGEPVTHFFFEYQGERAVDPGTLIESGTSLWHENVLGNEVHDNRYLWQLAATLLDGRQETPMYSWVEWLRYRITLGVLAPEGWDSQKPFPYKGLLISAIYLQEAWRICAAGDLTRISHIVAMAYYYLGLNTTASTLKNTSRAAQMMHAARSEKVRALVLAALNRIDLEGTASSIKQAKDQVVDLLRKKNKGWVRDCLNEFDTLVPEKTKGRKTGTQKNDVLDRLRNLLETWSLPSGPYPDIAESFSRFNKRKPKADAGATTTSAVNVSVSIDKSDCFLSLVNVFEDGHVLTMKISASDAEQTP